MFRPACAHGLLEAETNNPKETPICVPPHLGADAEPLKWNAMPWVCCQNISSIAEEIVLRLEMGTRSRHPRLQPILQ